MTNKTVLSDAQHTDDVAVDLFAAAMKAKLAKKREEGRNGWQHMSAAELSNLLHEHVEKGDPLDVANIAMMLHQNQQAVLQSPEIQQMRKDAVPVLRIYAAGSACHVTEWLDGALDLPDGDYTLYAIPIDDEAVDTAMEQKP